MFSKIELLITWFIYEDKEQGGKILVAFLKNKTKSLILISSIIKESVLFSCNFICLAKKIIA